MKHPNKAIMQQAIDYARRHRTVGCIIVNGDKIIVKCGGNILRPDATAHSEIEAIRKACKKLKSKELKGCWIYSTFEPCPMCASAIIWARMEGIVYGASMEDQNKNWTQRVFIRARDIIKHGRPKAKLIECFMREECKAVHRPDIVGRHKLIRISKKIGK